MLTEDVSKGYGFINCDNQKTYDRILEQKHFIIRNRKIEINHATRKDEKEGQDFLDKSQKKLFVGGLNGNTSPEDLFAHFSKYGELLTYYLIYDPITKQSKSKFQLKQDLDMWNILNPKKQNWHLSTLSI